MQTESVIDRNSDARRLFSFNSAYGKFSLLLLAITLVSLVPQYFTGLLAEPIGHSPQLIVHGAAFLAWYVLFSAQAGLASSGRIAIHRKLGYASIPFALLLVVSGGLMLAGTMQSYRPDWTEQYLYSRTSFVWAIAHTLVSFTVFYVLAVANRNNAKRHKRFMVLASLSMMAASITRFAYLPFIPIDGTTFTLLLTFTLLAIPLVIDRVRYGKVYPSLKYGTAAYVVTLLIAMGVMPATAIGRQLAFSL